MQNSGTSYANCPWGVSTKNQDPENVLHVSFCNTHVPLCSDKLPLTSNIFCCNHAFINCVQKPKTYCFYSNIVCAVYCLRH